jgi:predicted transposase YbfD/YdcC
VASRRTKNPDLQSLLDAFSEVEDPRVARTRAHPLVNVLTMSLFGALGGADGWDALAMYAREHEDFFSRFLEMPHGTPSADTFRRVFEALHPDAFQEAFRSWFEPLLGDLKGQTVAMDGKTLRGALAHSKQRDGKFHLLHVWATEHRLLLGQSAVQTAGNEAGAAEVLLSALHLEGATVTADAASCTAPLTAIIRERKAHYLLALKANQSALHGHVVAMFEAAAGAGERGSPSHVTADEAHGRLERRIIRALPIGKLPPNITAPWIDMKSVVQVDRVRCNDSLDVSRVYYISSLPPIAENLASRVRDHWKIENELHHVLDVTFGDDRRKIRSEYGAQNFALVCRHALSLLKREPTKMSVAMKRRRATWSLEYCLSLLTLGFHEA